MEIEKLGLVEIANALKEKKVSSVQLIKFYFDRIKKYKDKNALLEVFEDALIQAEQWDKKIASNEKIPLLAGVPIIIKDNMQYFGKRCTNASKLMENYISQYNSTAVQKLLDAGAVIIGRANMDEFAMGTSTENSAFGICKNPWDDACVPGGSSGGSACAVALGLAAAALGSDTGGSIRQPSALCGTVGLKGTYGRVSRYGLSAFGSSLDQIGPIVRKVEDAALMMQVIAGYDNNDMTSAKEPVHEYYKNLIPSVKGKKIGFVKEVEEVAKGSPYYNRYFKLREWFKQQGAEVIEVSIKNYKLALPVYYIIAPAEAASNLGRFDGIKFTSRASEAKTLSEIYKQSRSEYFGKEVKRRIMLGNFVLSSGYFDAYYVKAKRIQQTLTTDMEKAFLQCDILFMPTAYDEAFKLGDKQDPLALYLEDIFTVICNLTGNPAMSVPFGVGKRGLPIGLQLIAKSFDEQGLLNLAAYIEKNIGGFLIESEKEGI